MLEEAIALAVKFHSGQYRDGEVHGHRLPYIVHPIEVVKTLSTWGAGDTVTLTAAVLHDTLEDTPVTYEELKESFGDEVAGIVNELTYDPDAGPSKPEYLKGFVNASIPALVIKMADRYCNINDFLLVNPKYAKKYYDKCAALIEAARSRQREIAEVFGEEAAATIIGEYESLATVLESSIS